MISNGLKVDDVSYDKYRSSLSPVIFRRVDFERQELVVTNYKFKLGQLELSTKGIRDAVVNMTGNYLEIGFRLWECNEGRFFEALGYDDICDYALNEFGFKKSSTYNFIKVAKRFGEKLENGNGIPYYQMINDFRKFSFSQLVELMNLSDEQILQIPPETTVKQIREKKKEIQMTNSISDEVDTHIIAEAGIEELPDAAVNNNSISADVIQNDYDVNSNDDIGIVLTYDETLALKRFINFCNSDCYTDYKIIKDVYQVITDTLKEVGGSD